MKKLLVLLVLLSGILFPLACSDNNSNKGTGPTLPSGGGGGSVSATPTPISIVGPPGTPTFTPVFSIAAPVFQTNSSTSAAPHGMVINGGILTVAENEVTLGGIVTEIEEFTGAGTASLNLYNCCPGNYPNVGNAILTGCPPLQTPGATPIIFVPNVVGLQQVQGFVNPGGDTGAGAWCAILDLTSNGGANLYAGNIGSWNAPPVVQLNHNYLPFIGNSYGGVPFKNPSGMTADTTGGSGSIYIADTGNGTVDQLSPWEGICPLPALPIHQWSGFPGVTVGGTGVVFSSPAVAFRSPYAVSCDSTGNVWVGDPGYTSSYISEFTSGATTILESWQGVANCQAHGIAVDSSANCGGGPCVYVADAGNNLVEVYSTRGVLETEFGDPGPAAHEGHPFSPTSIAFSGGFLYVGDIGNNYIDVFN